MDNIPSRTAAFIQKWFQRFKKFFRQKKPLWFGPLIGALAGFVLGTAGVIAGIFMGLLIQILAEQIDTDKALLKYFEYPGQSRFREAEPGIAAYCALGVIILLESSHAARENRNADFDNPILFWDPIVQSAIRQFHIKGDDIPMVETFCRLAASRAALLNTDLLTESLIARRKNKEESLTAIGASLEALAFGDGLGEAQYIRSKLDPGYRISRKESAGINPWIILGLAPGASTNEIKSTYRKLATQFHPDQLQMLDSQRQHDAEKAFMKIKEAYREVMLERAGD